MNNRRIEEEKETNKKINRDRDVRTSSWKRLVLPIIIFSILISIIVVLSYNMGYIDDFDILGLKQEKVEDGWIITVTKARKAFTDSGYPFEDLYYDLNYSFSGSVEEINGIWDEHGLIIFYDNDNNNLVNKNDTFYISKSDKYQINSGAVLFLNHHKGSGFHIQLE